MLKICKSLLLTFALVLCFGTSFAQTISVTATITDSDSQVWNNMRWSVILYSPNGTPTYNGTPIPNTQFTGTGDVSVTLYNTNTITPIGAQYMWTLCSNTSAQCGQFLSPVTVANMSSTLSALVTAPRFSGLSGAYGYADAEVTNASTIGAAYYNVSTGLRISNGSAFAAVGGGGTCGTGNIPCTNTVNTWTSAQTFSAQLFASSGSAGAPGYSFSSDTNMGFYDGGGNLGMALGGGTGIFWNGNQQAMINTMALGWSNNPSGAAMRTRISELSAGVISFDTTATGNGLGIPIATKYTTTANCSSSASPAICGSASAGSFVIAAAATTIVINTTAVTANSQIIITPDETLGTKLGVTCNTTAASALATSGITNRVAGTSFTVTTTGTITTNPACYSYTIIN